MGKTGLIVRFREIYLAYHGRLSVWGANGDHSLRDTMSMYELWTAGVMLAGMCARYGKAGKYEHLGKFGVPSLCESAADLAAGV